MSFEAFWAKYPRRAARKDALKAWQQLNPSPALVVTMLAALDWQVLQDDWQRDNGRYTPLPASWIRGERWTDEQRPVGPARTKGGLLLECPHEEPCISRWACGIRQLQEQVLDDHSPSVQELQPKSGSRR